MNTEHLQELTEISASVARQIHPRYAVYFDQADIKQELILWGITHSRKINEWLNPEQDQADRKAGIKQLAKTLQREADKLCRTEKAKRSGYETRDEYFYTVPVLEEIIANIDALEHQQGGQNARVSGGGSDPSTGNNFAASVADVRKALDQQDPTDRLMLEMKFQEGLTYAQIADTLSMSDSTIHRRVTSALKRMVVLLGGTNPWIYQRERKPSTSEGIALAQDL